MCIVQYIVSSNSRGVKSFQPPPLHALFLFQCNSTSMTFLLPRFFCNAFKREYLLSYSNLKDSDIISQKNKRLKVKKRQKFCPTIIDVCVRLSMLFLGRDAFKRSQVNPHKICMLVNSNTSEYKNAGASPGGGSGVNCQLQL